MFSQGVSGYDFGVVKFRDCSAAEGAAQTATRRPPQAPQAAAKGRSATRVIFLRPPLLGFGCVLDFGACIDNRIYNSQLLDLCSDSAHPSFCSHHQAAIIRPQKHHDHPCEYPLSEKKLRYQSSHQADGHSPFDSLILSRLSTDLDAHGLLRLAMTLSGDVCTSSVPSPARSRIRIRR